MSIISDKIFLRSTGSTGDAQLVQDFHDLPQQMDFRRWREGIDREIEIGIEDVWTEKEEKGALGSLTFWVEQEDIKEDLLVLASDDYFEFDLSQFITAYSGKNALVAIHDIVDRNRASQFGVVEVERGRIVKCEEKPMYPKTSLIDIACYLLPPRLFPVLSRYHREHPEIDQLGHFITYLVKYDTVDAHVFTELWQDTAGILSLLGERGTPGALDENFSYWCWLCRFSHPCRACEYEIQCYRCRYRQD